MPGRQILFFKKKYSKKLENPMPSPRNPVAGSQDFRATAPYGTLILQDLKIPNAIAIYNQILGQFSELTLLYKKIPP
jgi:hypothetical protein